MASKIGFAFWKRSVDESSKQERISRLMFKMNVLFKLFLRKCSWLIYLISVLLMGACIYFFVCDYLRQKDLRRRRQEVQRSHDRISQRRRPGAACREHEIFRNILRKVHQFIRNNDKKTDSKGYVLRRSRSGAIYGRVADQEQTTE